MYTYIIIDLCMFLYEHIHHDSYPSNENRWLGNSRITGISLESHRRWWWFPYVFCCICSWTHWYLDDLQDDGKLVVVQRGSWPCKMFWVMICSASLDGPWWTPWSLSSTRYWSCVPAQQSVLDWANHVRIHSCQSLGIFSNAILLAFVSGVVSNHK